MSRRNNKPQPKRTFSIPASLVESYSDDVKQAEFKAYEPPPNVIPADKVNTVLAMDSTPYEMLNGFGLPAIYSGFRGYQYLALLSQKVEYANLQSVFADEMTRNWITVKTVDENRELVEQMENALKRYNIKQLIHEAVRQDAMYGVAHIFIDTGSNDAENEKPLFMSEKKVRKGDLKGFRLIEPVWVYPNQYNASNPLLDSFYKPERWYVMGKTIHASRFVDIISRPVPDIIKPAYNFGGLSLTQLMIDYVDRYECVNNSVSKIIQAFTVKGLKTDMDARMENTCEFDKRMKLFSKTQNNFGVWVIDAAEEFFQSSTPLSELNNLLLNYQEQLCIPARITQLKLLGTLSAGMNSGNGEMETWHETVSGYQERDIRKALERIFQIIQLSEFGEVKPEIYFEFNPLNELTEDEQANVTDKRVTSIVNASTAMLITPEEARVSLHAIPNGGFDHIDTDAEIDFGEENKDETEEPTGKDVKANGG